MALKKLGLIGLKNMGREHYTNLLTLVENGRIELAALCDNDSAALALPEVRHTVDQVHLLREQVASLTRMRVLELLHEKMQQVCPQPPALYSDYEEMLTKATLDGVIIATPNHLHREMAESALGRGINTLCEKPLATTVADCDAMLVAERESGAFLQVGLHMRYRRLYRYIKDLLDAGRLGNLKMVWCQEFRGDWNPEATHFDDGKGKLTNWRYMQVTSGGSIVEKLCHDFDLFGRLIGAVPRRIYAAGGKGVHKDRETIDHADICIEYENGVRLNLSMCMFAPNRRFKGRYIGFIGDQAVLDFENNSSSLTIFDRQGRVETHENVEENTRAGFHAGNASALQLQAFVESIERGTPPFAGAQIGRDSVAVAQAVQRSIEEGRVVEL